MRLAPLALALAAAGVAAAPLDFKGLPFGSDKAAIVKKFPGTRCVSTKGFSGCLLPESTTYAGQPVKQVSLQLVGGTLQAAHVAFEPGGFDGIVAALTEKYGPPKVHQTSTFTTLMGVKGQNVFYGWEAARRR